ncbi:MAG: bifunctional phosphoglucose/phosphomannose isomerase [Thermoanaerobacteraceae bacterium]|nr:bifunctional phosphoglucose/phosphomannose isomerase [Thermoanaerobacteraceae bacterium]
MIDLNDVAKISELDSKDSLITTENYDMQFKEGLSLAENFKIGKSVCDFDELVILGTGGGSSVSGGLLRSYLFDELKIPVIINQGYDIPAWVDENSLVFTLSHSGNTEETLSAFKRAKSRNSKIICITSGGKLQALCEESKIPCLLVPWDIGQPRRDLGYIFVPLLVILSKLGLIKDKTSEIKDLISMFSELKKEYGKEVPVEKNLAKQIAIELYNYIPLIYGSLDFYDSVAWRIKNQFGENSKLMAFYNNIPCLHHDEAVGWEMPQELISKFYLIILRDDELDTPKLKKRKDITAEMLKSRMGKVREIYAQGTSRLCRMFSLVYLGDFITLYAPIYRGVDPNPVEIINVFKKKMSEGAD